MQEEHIKFLPILIQLVVALGFVLTTVAVTHLKDFIFPKINSKAKGSNFESGIKSYGNARIPFSVKYFLVALLFVLFDVEVIFMYPWAVNFREMGMDGLLKMGLFISLLLIGFYYIIKKRALEWE
jgi:NADH-quinone oxidoreductase subunit A